MEKLILNKTDTSLTALTVNKKTGVATHYFIEKRLDSLGAVIEQVTSNNGYLNYDDERNTSTRTLEWHLTLDDALQYLITHQ